MTAVGRWFRGLGCCWLVFVGWLVGCAALADPPEAPPARPSASRSAEEPQQPRTVILPVYNATGRALRIAPDIHLGLFEPTLSPQDSTAGFTVPELMQAGFILSLQQADRHPAAMKWINDRVPDSPATIEEAWRLASAQQLKGHVVWIALTDWDDLAWRQRSIIRISAEVIVFEPGRSESLRAKTFDRTPFVIPPLSTLAQAAGHIGMRLASAMFP
jgi:hypothetical protein